jgi:hypothetical protein
VRALPSKSERTHSSPALSLRHIRVASKQELKNRILAAITYFNQRPVVHTWTYKLDKLLDMIRISETMI